MCEPAEAAAARLDEFEARWGQRYPAVVPAWRRAWEHVVPMFAFPPAIRKMIYTTNALESLHRSLRKIIKTRGSFPSDEAAARLLFLATATPGATYGALLTGPLRWGSLRSCSRIASPPQLAEPGDTMPTALITQKFGHPQPGSGDAPIERPDICLQLTCLITETAPCHAERTIYAIDTSYAACCNPPI